MPPKLQRRSTGAALSHAASGEEGPKSSKTSPAPVAASGRWTRSRSAARSHIGLDSTDHPRVLDSTATAGDDPDQAPARVAPKKCESSTAAGSVMKKMKKKTIAVGGRGGGGENVKEHAPATAAVTSTRLASWSVRGRYPDYPNYLDLQPGQHALSNKYMSAVEEWMEECSRISKLDKQACLEDILTLRDNPRDPLTPDAVVTSQDKVMVLRVAHSVVSVSSSKPDGELISQCTGIVIGWDGANKCAKILTSCSTVCDFDGEFYKPTFQLSVWMPNRTITEGRLLFFNVHYGIGFLEVTGDFQLQVPSFGLGINYGQDVFALARDENMSLMVRHGTISWLDYSGLLSKPYMFLSCDIPEVLMHYYVFSRVAHPMLGMQLKVVELLDVSMREELS